jgi:autotransporter translocation and assembly factor TamB
VDAKENRRRRWPWIAALTLGIVLGGGTLAARIFFHGPRLAGLVERTLNASIQGRVAVGSIEWPLSALPRVALGGPLPLVLRDVAVFDADGREVIAAERIELVLDSGAAILDQDLLIDDIYIPKGRVLLKQIVEPQPKHEYDDHTISLTSAFRAKGAGRIGFRAGVGARPSPIFDLRSYRLDDVQLTAEFPGWRAVAEHIRVERGFLTFDGKDPLAGKLYYALSPKAPKATMTIGEGPTATVIDVTSLDVVHLRQIPWGWPDDPMPGTFEYVANVTTADGAKVALDGKIFQSFTDIFGGVHDLKVDVTEAGALASRLTQGKVGGAKLALGFRLQGPGLAPEYRATVADLELRVPIAAGRPPLELTLPRLAASWNDATRSGSIEDTTLHGAGGEVRLSATFTRRPDVADLDVEVTRPIELAPYLPPAVTRQLGGRLAGRFHAHGTVEAQRLDQLDLRLGRARVTGGLTRDAAGVIHPDDLEVAVGGTALRRIRGSIDTTTKAIDLDLRLASTDTARVLRSFGQPPLATSLDGDVTVRGYLDDPEVRADLRAGGVPVVGRLDARVAYHDGVVQLDRASASALGGQLDASGRIVIAGRPRLEGVRAGARGLDLSTLPGIGDLLTGRLDLDATASGSLRAPRGQANATVADLTIAGEPYRDARVEVVAAADEPIAVRAGLEREAGGALTVDASYDPRRRGLAGAVDLRRLPLDAIAALIGRPEAFGGELDATVTLSGTAAAPTADGTIELAGGWFGNAFLGAAGIAVERAPDGRLHLTARLLQGALELDGLVATRAPYAAEVVVRLHRVELDRFAGPTMAERGVRGWVSGEVTYRGALADAARTAAVTAHLTEAVVVLEDPLAGRPGGLRLANQGPIDLTYDGETLALTHEIAMLGPTGTILISGRASRRELALEARGTIAMALLTPYVRQYFDRVSGEVAVRLTVGGSPAAPKLGGVVEIVDVAMQPTGQDTIVRIPGGKIELDGEQVSLTGLSMRVADEFSSEQSELSIAGGLRLDGLRPAMWAIRVDGKLDGKMLLVLAPQAFSSGFGSADLSIALLGEGAQPDIDGTVEFTPETPLTIVPRRARREIALTGGFVRFTDQLIELGDVRGTVDDEGVIERLEGEISLDAWRPVDVDVSIDASALPVRIPDTLELSANLRGLRLVGGADGIDIGGTIEVPDGRLTRKFNLFTDVLKPERASTPTRPFWETDPLLANARLDLTIVAQAFYVRNNIAQIAMSGQLAIGGTPAAPRFDGVVRVDDGQFKLTFIRPRFERAAGTVTFAPTRTFPDGTPTLDLHAEADYKDAGGQAHLIHLTLKGTLSNIDWDLRTEAGLNRAQTIQLALARRTPDEVRVALGDTAIGKPGAVADATAGGGGFVYADQFVKDLSGDFFSLLIGDSLRSVTQLDVIRLQLGTNAIGAHAEAKFTPSLRAIGDFERSLRGWFWDVTGEYKITDAWSFEGSRNGRYYDDEALEDEENTTVQTTWRWVLLP